MYLSLEFIPIRDSEIRGINTSESCTCYFFVKRIGSSLPFDAHWEVIIASGTTLFCVLNNLMSVRKIHFEFLNIDGVFSRKMLTRFSKYQPLAKTQLWPFDDI